MKYYFIFDTVRNASPFNKAALEMGLLPHQTHCEDWDWLSKDPHSLVCVQNISGPQLAKLKELFEIAPGAVRQTSNAPMDPLVEKWADFLKDLGFTRTLPMVEAAESPPVRAVYADLPSKYPVE